MNRIKNRIFTATMCSDWKDIATEYGVGVELDHLCQAQYMDGEDGARTREEMEGIVADYGRCIFHGPFNEIFPAAIDPQAREFAMRRLNQAAWMGIDIGLKKMVVHSGYVPFVYFKEWHVDRSVEFWKDFMEDKPKDFKIAIENVLDDEPYMLAEIARRVDDSRVGVCYDTGHANIEGKGRMSEYDLHKETTDQKEWLKVLSPYLSHLHIHNNDGKGDYHRGLEEGNVDIGGILDFVRESCRQDTTVTVEVLEGGDSFTWLRQRGYI